MKLKIKRLKKGPVEKPDIYEKDIYRDIRFFLVVYLVPILTVAMVLFCVLHPELSLKTAVPAYSVVLGLYLVMISMIREGTKIFWIAFFIIMVSRIYFIFSDAPEHYLFPQYTGILYFCSITAVIVIYIMWQVKHQYDEHTRNPNEKFSGEVKVKKFSLKNSRLKKLRIIKKMKINKQMLKRTKPLQLLEPAEFSSIRAKLTLWGLPLLTLVLIILGFFGDIASYPQYVTAAAMGLGCFLFLVSMIRPATATFWVVFMLILIIGTPMAIWPPSLLPSDKETQIVLISILFSGTAGVYWFKIKKN